MADKSPRRDSAKVAGKTLKEKRADKKQKHNLMMADSDAVSHVKRR